MANKTSALGVIKYDVLNRLPLKAKELCRRYPPLLTATVSGIMETSRNFVKAQGGVLPW